MALRWDSLLVRALARELNERLAGARLRALRLDGATRDLVLLFRETTLVWRLHPTRGAPALYPEATPQPGDLPLPSKVRAVRAPTDERVLVFELLPVRGRRHRDVVVELLGNQWNALVTEGPEARIRHVLVRRDAPRPLRVGSVYQPPTPSPREGAESSLSVHRWRELLTHVSPDARARSLVSQVAWTSPLNARALLEADRDPEVALAEGHRIWSEWASGKAAPEPTLLELERGPQPYPWPMPGVEGRPMDTLLDAFETWTLGHGGKGLRTVALPPDLLLSLERALVQAERRVSRLRAELAAVEDPGELRALGDLLLARLATVPTGAAEAVLQDFEGNSVTVALDPSLPPHQNAQSFYAQASRAERAAARLPDLIQNAEATVADLEHLLDRARSGDTTPDEVRMALPPVVTPSQDRSAEPAVPYRVYRSSGGLEIRVGRGARHNDALTFHHAAPDDIWLHARHAAGAHVVMRWTDPGNPPARDLEEAAVLAALHSRSRTSGSVPVDWTRRKYVRKPRGSAPGTVIPQRVKTVFVAPDADVEERLKEG